MVDERGTPRLVMTELQSPSSASVASFGSRSARNSPRRDALGEQPLDQFLIGVRQCGDGLPRPVRQFVAVPDEHADIVGIGVPPQRREMVRDRGAELVGGAGRLGDDGLQVRDEVLDAELADRGERGLLGREIVVEARLPHAEPLGDVARAGAGIALLGEHGRGRVEHLAIAALPARRRLPAGGGGR